MQFLLGAHHPIWLTRAPVPLFVCDSELRERVRLRRACTEWALDSGGFSELQQNGRWTVTPEEYAERVRRYRDEIGRLLWAAPQDWMCEPAIIHGGQFGRMKFVGTHLSVAEHQRRTVENLVHLRTIAPDVPWIPVLQGYTADEYMSCVIEYEQAGVNLTTEPLVGLGSVCRRQATREAHEIIRVIREAGITRIHGFGVKTLGLERYGHLLTSADSLAWSSRARWAGRPVPPCTHTIPKNCANCLPFALRWRDRVLANLPTCWQLTLNDAA